MLSDFDAIRGIDSTVFSGAERSLDYYLSGRISVHNLRARGQTEGADFLLTHERATDETALLTPRNREVFLYDRAAFHAQYAHLGEPVWRGGSGWKVHAAGTRLIYTTGESCAARQGFTTEAPFFVEIRDAEGNAATGWPSDRASAAAHSRFARSSSTGSRTRNFSCIDCVTASSMTIEPPCRRPPP